jgi:flagellar hook assembly protein FlgD
VVVASWDGTIDSGEEAGNGTYYIKIDNIDPTGVDSTVTRQVMLNRHLSRVEVNIYNEAGEVVRHLSGTVADTAALNTSFTLSSGILTPSAQGGPGASLTVTLADGTVLTWDGRGDSGSFLASGQYFIELKDNDGQGGDTTVIKQVTVVNSGTSLGTVLAYPNPDKAATDGSVIHFVLNSTVSTTLKVKVYTMAGELVGKAEGLWGTGNVDWDTSGIGLASGVYFAVVEIVDPQGGIQRQILKILIIR